MKPASVLPLLCLFFGLFWHVAHADSVPKLIKFQGNLTNAAGAVIVLADGEYSLEVKLCDSGNAGTLDWGETRVVTLMGGVFNVALIGTGGIPSARAAVNNDLSFAFGGAERFQEASVVGEPSGVIGKVVMPQQQLASAPFTIATFNGNSPDTVVPFFGTTAPKGWLICSGQLLAREGTFARPFVFVTTSWVVPDFETCPLNAACNLIIKY